MRPRRPSRGGATADWAGSEGALDPRPPRALRSGRLETAAGSARADQPAEVGIQTRLEITVEFRACRRDDLPALEWMGLHTPDRPIIDAAFAAQERGDALMLVGDSAGFPVAQVWIDFTERGTHECPHLWAVRVFPPLQRAGLGGALMEAAERHAVSAGARALELGVEPGNPGAWRFYERLGYRPVGAREEVVRHGADGEVQRADPHQLILRKPIRSERRAARS